MDVRSMVRRNDIYWAVYSNECSIKGVEGGGRRRRRLESQGEEDGVMGADIGGWWELKEA